MSLDRTIRLYPLTFVTEGDGVAIGRFGTDAFAIFPTDGAELLQKLQAGETLAKAKAWYESTFNESVDIEDFLDTLRQCQFLIEDNEEIPTEQVIPWQRFGKAVFSTYAWILYALLALYCIYDLIRFPALRPHYSHVFFSPYLMVIEIVLMLSQYPGALFHEAFHMLAGRRRGLPSRLSFGRRMYYFVLQSSMPGIIGLERRQRYLPYLAGMLGDVVWFCLLTLIAGFLLQMSSHWSSIGEAILGIAYMTILRFLWQFYIYLQTDIYFVVTTLLGCVNLQQTTKEYLHNWWNRRRGKLHLLVDELAWAERDRQVARYYVYFYVTGWLWSAVVFVFFLLPVLWRFIEHIFAQLTVHVLNVSFWDSFVFLIMNVVQYLIVLFIYLRERRARKKSNHPAQITI